LQEPFLSGWQPVDPGGQDGLHRDRYLDGREGVHQVVGAPLPHQLLGLDQRAHALFQKEGITLSALDE
jgi:hypothetical protein